MSGVEAPPDVLVRLTRSDAYEDARVSARACAILDAAERATLERLRPAGARRDYLAAHALARNALAELAGCDASELRMRASQHGRPEVVYPPEARRFRMSLSHADGIALCAVATECAIGCDVESLRNIGPDPLAVAEGVFSEEERAALHSLSPPARADRVLYLWTLKEAVLKATGLGFHLDPAHVSVRLDAGSRPMVEFDARVGEDARAWRLDAWRPTRWHVAAVALREV